MQPKIKLVISFTLMLLSGYCYCQGNNNLLRFENSPSIWSPKGYSQMVIVDLGKSNLLIISGQIPFDSAGNLIGKGDFARQTEQIFQNIKKLVVQAGGSMNDLTKLSYFVTDITQVTTLRTIRNKYINTEKPPASTLVQVSKLFRDDILLEVEAMAVVPKK